MKVKELNSDISLSSIKIRIPDEYKRECISAGLNTMEVYLKSTWFNGIWVKTSLNSDRVFPLSIIPSEVLEWEVI